MNAGVIAVMAKQPLAGKTKTRLCPPFTFQEAAGFYEALMLDTLELVGGLEEVDLAVAFTPPDSKTYFEGVTAPGTLLLSVAGIDIGDCMEQTFRQLFDIGYTMVLALNSDGPTIPLAYLRQGLSLLDEQDLVLGPAEDGGYYLIGMKWLEAGIFRDIAWSTDQVLSQTLLRAKEFELRTALTSVWHDVDSLQDCVCLKTELESLPNERLQHTRKFFAGFER